MFTRSVSQTLFVTLLALVVAGDEFSKHAAAAPPKRQPRANPQQSGRIRDLLQQTITKFRLPAVSAAVIVDGNIVAADAAGVRKMGSPARVAASDAFHLGSCAKAMTATVIGILIDKGKINWDSTLADAFPELQGVMHPGYRQVTVEQLLAHRGGLPRNPAGMTPPDIHALPGRNQRQKRQAFAKLVLKQAPAAAAGQQFEYSNVGYTLLGAMAEQATNQPWEQLLTELIFKPLDMRSAHFGDVRAGRQIDRPWGHLTMGGRVMPIPPGPNPNDPPAMSPAGSVVHCSMADFAKFASAHFYGQDEHNGLLKPKTLKRLHTPLVAEDGYAAGWMAVDREWAGGKLLHHAGASPMTYCVIYLAPERKLAVVVAANIGPDSADRPCKGLASQLLKLYSQDKAEKQPGAKKQPGGKRQPAADRGLPK